MSYNSMTGQFRQNELDLLQSMPAEQLIAALIDSDPIVALRAITEVLMNQDEAKLGELLSNGDLMDHWRGLSFYSSSFWA